MKKITFAFFVFTLLFNPVLSNSRDFVFYHFKELKTLHRIDGFITIKFKENVSQASKSALSRIFNGYIKDEMTFKTGRESSSSSEAVIFRLRENLSKNIADNLMRIAAENPDVESVGYGYKADGKVVHFTTNEIIVKFRSFIATGELNNLNSLFKTRIIEKVSLFDNTYLISVESNGIDGRDNVFDAAIKFALLQNVELAQPNFIRYGMLLETGVPHKKHDLPNDPLLPQMWHLNNSGQSLPNGVHGIPGCDMNVFSAWEVTTGDPNVLIAIVDTGVDTNHTDLRGNLTDRSQWYDAYDNDQKPYDEYYHGTGVSGTCSAIGNNDSGTVGVAYTSKLLPVRVFGPWPTALTTDLILAKGLNWAWMHGASVINCSWGGGIPTPLISYSIQNAIKYGRNNRGTVICAGSGNDDVEQVLYPSSMDEVFSCGGLSPCNERKHKHSCDFNGIDSSTYWGASYGEGLDFVVPCSYIGTTQLLGSWCICGNGTSCSAPLAAGVVALVLSKNINLSYDSVKIVISKSCVKVGNYNYNVPKQYGMWNNEMGYGRIDARAALDMTPSGPGVIGDKVSPIIKIFPPESRVFSSNISFNAEIYDNISMAGGSNSPRLYFRSLQYTGLQSTLGKPIGNNMYNFNFPIIPVSEGFYYYISAQDQAIDPNVITYPIGGKGINPPGNIAPGKLMYVRNTTLFDTSFTSLDVPKIIPTNNETTFVSVLNNVPGRIVCDVNCTINITHSYDADLTLVLISPSGTKVIILGGVGWEGDGFDNTTLDDDASISIDSSAAVPPYIGSFKPVEKLWLFDGENAAGQWKLQVTDNGHGDGGSLNSWSLGFKYATNDGINLPGSFGLVRNYPNPFNPKTRIVFNVPYTAKVKLTIYDLTGREVTTLLNETRTARLEDFIDFDSSDPAFNNGRGLASGVYFVNMIADDNFIETKKLVLVK